MTSSSFWGIDTSNYTTSLAVSTGGAVTRNLKRMLPVREGERGLRQSDALFTHTIQLPMLFEELRGGVSPAAVGVSEKPRDAEGSYMPCFLAGVSCAGAIAAAGGIPLYRFSHQAGHIAAALYSAGKECLLRERFLAFHVSGGTTEITLCENGRITLLGGTKDISMGKAVDRIGVKLGLSFPCGKELEKLAGDGIDAVKPGKLSVDGLHFNLSGIENKADELLRKGAGPAGVAAYTFAVLTAILEKLTENALTAYPGLPLLFTGGVMSNAYIRRKMTEKYGAFFADPAFSCDNAAGIARLTELRYHGEI